MYQRAHKALQEQLALQVPRGPQAPPVLRVLWGHWERSALKASEGIPALAGRRGLVVRLVLKASEGILDYGETKGHAVRSGQRVSAATQALVVRWGHKDLKVNKDQLGSCQHPSKSRS